MRWPRLVLVGDARPEPLDTALPRERQAFFSIPPATFNALVPVLAKIPPSAVSSQLSALGSADKETLGKMALFLDKARQRMTVLLPQSCCLSFAARSLPWPSVPRDCWPLLTSAVSACFLPQVPLPTIRALVPLIAGLSDAQIATLDRLMSALSPGQTTLAVHLLQVHRSCAADMGSAAPQRARPHAHMPTCLRLPVTATPQVFGPALDVIGDNMPRSVPSRGVISIGPLRVVMGGAPAAAPSGRLHPILGALQRN